MADEARVSSGRNEHTTFVMVNAQSVKNTDTAQHKGYDAGKKTSCIKRHIAVDTQGLPHAIALTTAEVTDRKGALQAFTSHQKSLSHLMNVLAEGAYTGEPFANGVCEILGASVEIAKRNELHTFAVMPNGGRLNVLLLGLINVEGCGKTVSVSSIPVFSLLIWPSSFCSCGENHIRNCQKDFEQSLKNSSRQVQRLHSTERNAGLQRLGQRFVPS